MFSHFSEARHRTEFEWREVGPHVELIGGCAWSRMELQGSFLWPKTPGCFQQDPVFTQGLVQ